MERAILFAALLAITAVRADDKLPPPPGKPDVVFPKMLPGQTVVQPLESFPQREKSLMRSSDFGASTKSSTGTRFRVVEATADEVRYATSSLEKRRQQAKKLTPIGEQVRAKVGQSSLLRELPLVAQYEENPVGGPTPSRFVFWFQDGSRTIYLRERHLATDGAGIVAIAEYVTGAINGNPAVLVARKNDLAGAYWTLTWTQGSIDYEIGLHEPAFTPETADRMVALGESVR